MIANNPILNKNAVSHLEEILKSVASDKEVLWLQIQMEDLVEKQSTRDFYLTYTLIRQRFSDTPALLSTSDDKLDQYLYTHDAKAYEVARILLLNFVLDADPEFFRDKVQHLIEVADRKELESFLKFLVLLPNPEEYRFTAVEALRTNISDIFDAISLENPYPALYFNEQQWNQMYLKAAFMQRPLQKIMYVEDRANAELTRIISDYAHERWAAGRTIDPMIWRPVAKFLDPTILNDIKRLINSDDPAENKAALLVCAAADTPEAAELLVLHSPDPERLRSESINWNNLNT
ncbi:EboA domain-containing protein [Robertkochia solimangrovi]|uniref:EboA domain-containing protein n=1 Tax=Robertkochia solimangrovi TaxID=2213046 RepID=UPI00117DFC3A|nr:EboA domain-containing protein [Robertkochia solimangrovi]TRZ42886.1 hypothetical protein DMZ48_12530 [Robertkochia solimangrovi]